MRNQSKLFCVLFSLFALVFVIQFDRVDHNILSKPLSRMSLINLMITGADRGSVPATRGMCTLSGGQPLPVWGSWAVAFHHS